MAHFEPEFYLQMGKSFNISFNFMFFRDSRRSELIRRRLVVRVDPVLLLYLPVQIQMHVTASFIITGP